MNTRMPVLFVGHGSPLYAIEDNQWSRAFRSFSTLAPRPRAILMISAHWFTNGTFVTSNENPPTVHDFYGFPQELNEVEYSAPGDVNLARQVRRLIGEDRVELNSDWGLDHGTWSVLRWMYPNADVPVVELSIDRNLTPSQHFELVRALHPLREEGVLIVGSGNVTHNLRDFMTRSQAGDESIPDWAKRFDDRLRDILLARDTKALLDLWPLSEDARHSHPSPEHFLPIIYTYAASDSSDAVRFPLEGFDRSISMRAILFHGD
jgi:4,5-DOPA dioxygenase extradiol